MLQDSDNESELGKEGGAASEKEGTDNDNDVEEDDDKGQPKAQAARSPSPAVLISEEEKQAQLVCNWRFFYCQDLHYSLVLKVLKALESISFGLV